MPSGANQHKGGKVGGHAVTRRSGRPSQRRGPRNVGVPEFDEFGLPTDSKYRGLGPRNRRNVAIAIGEGFVYAKTSGTTEEQCCYGELRRRGFTVGENSSPRWFVTQFPLKGDILDFYGGDAGALFALRPMNRYWHGHATELYSDGEDVQRLLEAVASLYDIWDGDSLVDDGIKSRFDLFFGAT